MLALWPCALHQGAVSARFALPPGDLAQQFPQEFYTLGSMCIKLNPVHTDITHSVLSFCHALFGGGQQL